MAMPKKDVLKVNINLERKVKEQFNKLYHDSITGKVAYGALSDVVNRLLVKHLHETGKVDLSDLMGEKDE